jgi:pimeloyl-ACP methyl ester carboxylesterase
VIAYARRGYDRSERAPPGDAGTTVGDLIALLDCLGIDRAHVLGAAAGGITALAFAVAHPERCRSLVLAGTIFSPAEEEWRKAYARLGMAAAKDALPVDFLELGPTYRFVYPEGVDLFVKLSGEARHAGPEPQPSGVSVTWQELRRLDVATLMLTGEADLYAPPPLQAMMARHIPRHELVTLSEVGHAAYWERPHAFNEIVLRFLAKHAGRQN